MKRTAKSPWEHWVEQISEAERIHTMERSSEESLHSISSIPAANCFAATNTDYPNQSVGASIEVMQAHAGLRNETQREGSRFAQIGLTLADTTAGPPESSDFVRRRSVSLVFDSKTTPPQEHAVQYEQPTNLI